MANPQAADAVAPIAPIDPSSAVPPAVDGWGVAPPAPPSAPAADAVAPIAPAVAVEKKAPQWFVVEGQDPVECTLMWRDPYGPLPHINWVHPNEVQDMSQRGWNIGPVPDKCKHS